MLQPFFIQRDFALTEEDDFKLNVLPHVRPEVLLHGEACPQYVVALLVGWVIQEYWE